MRIARLSLRNVGPFDDATLEPPPPSGDGELVLFEGPNGSGKTTIAEAIARLVPGSEEEQAHLRLRDGGEASIALEHEGLVQRVALGPGKQLKLDPPAAPSGPHLVFNPHRNNRPSWAAFAYHAHTASASLDTDGPREMSQPPLHHALNFGQGFLFAKFLGQLLVNLEFERVQSAQYALERPDRAHEFTAAAEGTRLAISRLERAFSALLNRTVTIRFQPGRLTPRMLFDGDEIPIELLGEGMRSTLSWVSDLLVRLERIHWADEKRLPWDQEFWLILDEIEASLHPAMQLRILPTLRELFPRARIYATTHSPFVVASAGEGHVFAIRPDPTTHRISGNLTPTKLTPGQSLEWVVESIFRVPTGIVDVETRAALGEHEREVDALRGGGPIDWDRFLARRARLVGLNDEVSTIVRMTEGPVRRIVDAKLVGAQP